MSTLGMLGLLGDMENWSNFTLIVRYCEFLAKLI